LIYFYYTKLIKNCPDDIAFFRMPKHYNNLCLLSNSYKISFNKEIILNVTGKKYFADESFSTNKPTLQHLEL
jgi:hypothetical protein